MAFGNIKKEELLEIVKDLKEEHLIKACEYLSNKNYSKFRKASTHFIVYQNKKYPLKYTFEIANNEILNNNIKIGPNTQINEDTWTSSIVLSKLIQNPQQIKIVTPYNDEGRKYIEKIRINLLEFAKNKGFTVNTAPKEYTAIALKKNIAEIHNIKSGKFRTIFKYDELPETLRANVKKLPDTYRWTLDGEFYVKNETDAEQVKKILEFFANFTPKINDDDSINNNELIEDIKNLQWYSIIALSMYINDFSKTYKVHELEQHPLIVEFSKQRLSKTVYLTVIGQLQIHADNNSKTVNYKKRTKPLIFDKNEQAEWYLTNDGIKYVEDKLSKYIDKYRNFANYVSNTNKLNEEPELLKKYTSSDFVNEVFMDNIQYETLKNLLLNKKNIILQGAPGVGKTYTAKRLAYSILGVKDDDKIEMIQFHQSYGYEDFIMGYRPSEKGFELVKGPFYEFCKKAEKHPENKYFFIIDEINRGKLSKIFGELLMLVETDKRGHNMRLMYEKELFSVPENLYIIGMMNTADRSIAMIDYALRRRFAFYDFKPAFETQNFKDYQQKQNNKKFNLLIDEIIKLNTEITNDNCLGAGFQIGHSYFCNDNVTDEWLNFVVEYEILPLLNEYWFDEQAKIDKWQDILRKIVK